VRATLFFLALSALAADVTVRREGAAFRVAGARSEAEIAVYAGDAADLPPVLGTFAREGAEIVFRPRFALSPGVDARVVVAGREFRFPGVRQERERTTAVERVYPSGPRIPANQLKFYIQFSAPMLPGEAWEHVRLLDAGGKAVELAFLEIDQELWDPDRRRLTVLFDPGRIKRGVLPRDEVGAALVAGRSYTLEIGAAWRDAERVPLKAGFRHRFEVVAEDRSAIDPARWRMTRPAPGSRDPLVVDFGEPLDAALALRLIRVAGIEGQAELGREEREWRFTPERPWPAGALELEVDTALEDLAGNKVHRPFDVDTFDPITPVRRGAVVRVPVR
jgi:hypothetical protein